jgi:hypothetical protein
VAINSELQAIRSLRQFIKDGGLTILTEFVYKNQPKTGFRTSIQLDGCIINFVPDPDQFSTPEEQQLLNNYLKQHQKKIQDFLKQINELNSFLQRILYFLFSGNAILGSLLVEIQESMQIHPFLAYLYELHPYLISVLWFLISGFVGSLIFYYIVLPFIWHLAVRKVRSKF